MNLGDTAGQCRLRIPELRLSGDSVPLVDLIGPARYEHPASELRNPGLYLDTPTLGSHLFRIG